MRLAPLLPESEAELARTTASALSSDDAELIHVALWLARELDVAVDATRVRELTGHEDGRVAAAATQLISAQPERGQTGPARIKGCE